MMTLAPIRSAEHAASYYEQSEHSDYYARDEVCPSYWAGVAAESLGILGSPVDKKQFRQFLNGEIAGQILGTMKNDKQVRRPATDCVFSPPKSVSLAALVGGDGRVVKAHDAAVNAAIELLEKEAAFTRKHSLDEIGRHLINHEHTGNLLCAVFRHDTSRSLSPQLHSHAVIINATRIESKEWRSIESRHLYCLQKKAGLLYRQELAANLKKLGYKITRKEESFEIEGFSQEILDAFSQRRDAIDQALEERGYTRNSAPAGLKEKLAKILREKKEYVDNEILQDRWQQSEKEHKFDSKVIVDAAVKRSGQPGFDERIKSSNYEALDRIVKDSLDHLLERDSVVSLANLESQINKQAVGHGISAVDVQSLLAIMAAEGELIERTKREYSSQFQCWREVLAYTTPAVVARENDLLQLVSHGAGKQKRLKQDNQIEEILSNAERTSQKLGFDGWNTGQRSALRGLLQSQDSVVAVNGYAGTAKTSTVLKEYYKVCTDLGFQVIGMAPSASAAQTLADGAGFESTTTVASHLLKSSYLSNTSRQQIWVIDEASLLSTNDMYSLVKQADKQSARIVLVGDIQQLGSVEAGATFRQLQNFGVQTYQLDEIVRQENEGALSAVYASIEGDVTKAIKLLSGDGGEVVQVAGDETKRHEAIIESWLALSKAERDRTLIIDPSRAGRRALTVDIREALQNEGSLAEESVKTKQLERVDHTKSSRRDVFNYEIGDYIRFGKDYKSQKISKNSYWNIVGRDTKNNTLTIEDISGRQLVWNPKALWGSRSLAFRPVEVDLCENDKIIWTQNEKSKGLTNGMKGIVRHVDQESQTANILFDNGKSIQVNLNDPASLNWSHNYVTTAHASQGQTADQVIYHAESFRRNLASQKSFYVAISRAKHKTIVVTDDRFALEQQVAEHNGEKQNAVEYELLQEGIEL